MSKNNTTTTVGATPESIAETTTKTPTPAAEAADTTTAPIAKAATEETAIPNPPEDDEEASKPKKDDESSGAINTEEPTKPNSGDNNSSSGEIKKDQATAAIKGAVDEAFTKSVKTGSAQDRKEFYIGLQESLLQNPDFLKAALTDPDEDMIAFLKQDDASNTLVKLILSITGKDKTTLDRTKIPALQKIIENFSFLGEDVKEPKQEAKSILEALKKCENISGVEAEAKACSKEFSKDLTEKVSKNLSSNKSLAFNLLFKGSAIAAIAAISATGGPLILVISAIALIYYLKKKKDKQSEETEDEVKSYIKEKAPENYNENAFDTRVEEITDALDNEAEEEGEEISEDEAEEDKKEDKKEEEKEDKPTAIASAEEGAAGKKKEEKGDSSPETSTQTVVDAIKETNAALTEKGNEVAAHIGTAQASLEAISSSTPEVAPIIAPEVKVVKKEKEPTITPPASNEADAKENDTWQNRTTPTPAPEEHHR